MPKRSANPFSHKVIMSVLAFVAAAGGYGGYQVVKSYGTFGADFDSRPHLVESVVDGDTVTIEDGIRIRLLGINAPESGDCFGPEAKAALSKLLLGQRITLEKDQASTDKYDRLLRYVILPDDNPAAGNLLVNAELVKRGFARSLYIKPNRKYLSQIQAAEADAKEKKLGLWATCPETKIEDPDREQASDPFDKECVIKGSLSKQFEKTYFLPGCPDYKQVKVDPRKGEKWFCNEAEAEKDGWHKAPVCNNLFK